MDLKERLSEGKIIIFGVSINKKGSNKTFES